MEVGDAITLTNPIVNDLDQLKTPGVVLEVERYRGAYIVRWRSQKSGGEAVFCCFPQFQYLPPLMGVEDPRYYASAAYVEWGEHIWPVPVGKPSPGTHRIEGDPRAHVRAKVDHILWLAEHAHMTADITGTPRNEEEESIWRKWLAH